MKTCDCERGGSRDWKAFLIAAAIICAFFLGAMMCDAEPEMARIDWEMLDQYPPKVKQDLFAMAVASAAASEGVSEDADTGGGVLAPPAASQPPVAVSTGMRNGEPEARAAVNIYSLKQNWGDYTWGEWATVVLGGIATGAGVYYGGKELEWWAADDGGDEPIANTSFTDTDRRGSTTATGFDRCTKTTEDNESGSGKREVKCERFQK